MIIIVSVILSLWWMFVVVQDLPDCLNSPLGKVRVYMYMRLCVSQTPNFIECFSVYVSCIT